MNKKLFEIKEIEEILNRKDLGVRTYFTKKIGSNYTTYSPSIDGDVHEELMKLITNNIENFKDHEQVYFSPVGYKDGTVEVCDVNYIETFDDLINTFMDDEKIQRDSIEQEDINSLNFYTIKVQYEKNEEDKELYIFRRITKFRKLSEKGMFGSINKNSFSKLDSSILGLDGDVDLIVYEDKILILNHISLERIFSLYSQYLKNAQKAIDIVKKAGRISNFNQFEEDCLNDRRVNRILTKMLSEDGDLENCFENFSNVIDVIDIFELEIDIDNSEEKGIIIYEDKSQIMDVIRLVRDSYYKSIIREEPGVNDSI